MTYPDPDLEKVHCLVAKLEHWWWSTRHPSFIISKVENDHKSKGLFNIFWVLSGCQNGAIRATDEIRQILFRLHDLMPVLVDGHPVYEWATVLTPKQFYDQIVKPWKAKEFEMVADYEFWRIKFSAAG